MNVTEARSLMLHFVAAWPTQPWGDETLALYVAELCRWEQTQAEAAVRDLVRTSKWCPTISELVEGCERFAIQPVRRELERGPRSPILSAAEREHGQRKVAELLESMRLAHAVAPVPPRRTASNPKRYSSGRRYVVDPKTGNAEVAR